MDGFTPLSFSQQIRPLDQGSVGCQSVKHFSLSLSLSKTIPSSGWLSPAGSRCSLCWSWIPVSCLHLWIYSELGSFDSFTARLWKHGSSFAIMLVMKWAALVNWTVRWQVRSHTAGLLESSEWFRCFFQTCVRTVSDSTHTAPCLACDWLTGRGPPLGGGAHSGEDLLRASTCAESDCPPLRKSTTVVLCSWCRSSFPTLHSVTSNSAVLLLCCRRLFYILFASQITFHQKVYSSFFFFLLREGIQLDFFFKL